MNSQTAHITGFSANTSLGDVVTACAAARARSSRPGDLELETFDPAEGAIPVIGHPVETASGFQGEARLLALALPALLDLLAALDLTGERAVGIALALPDLATRARVGGAAPPASIGLLDRLVVMADLQSPPAMRRAFTVGAGGFAMALETGLELVNRGHVNLCVVGAVDTLCDTVALDALASERRLKTPGNPIGLQPGEAAAFVLLESASSVRRRGSVSHAILSGVAAAEEPHGDGKRALGEGIAKAIIQLAGDGSPIRVQDMWFVVDLNGEDSRAVDWQSCYPRLALQVPGFAPPPPWIPALSFGDTGAASAAIGVLMIIRAFARNYAPERCGMVISSADESLRTAIRIEREVR